jgi:hypothetical protein
VLESLELSFFDVFDDRQRFDCLLYFHPSELEFLEKDLLNNCGRNWLLNWIRIDFLFNRFKLRQAKQIFFIEKCVNIYFDRSSMIDLLRVFQMMELIPFFLILYRILVKDAPSHSTPLQVWVSLLNWIYTSLKSSMSWSR